MKKVVSMVMHRKMEDWRELRFSQIVLNCITQKYRSVNCIVCKIAL